jgi:flagellar motor switch protein FliN/FliY
VDQQILSQDEINALLQNTDTDTPVAPKLSVEQRDALGEIGNISYGTAATALSKMLNKRVEINTPTVFLTTPQELKEQHPTPYVLLEVDYKDGLIGSNLLILKVCDASVIANLFMGGNGLDIKDTLDEMELSAVAEAMNQMAGNAATSLSTLFAKKVDMKPPQVRIVDFANSSEAIKKDLQNNDYMSAVQFRLLIEDLVDSEITLLIPYDFSVQLVDILLGNVQQPVAGPSTVKSAPVPAPAPKPVKQSAGPVENYSYTNSDQTVAPPPSVVPTPPQQQVMVQPAKFAAFGNNKLPKDGGNIGLILDVPLQVTVELGSTRMKIKEILELGMGSVIELDRLAGDPVDIFVNGKLIAKGEVVVIDENFGIKVTDIVNHIERVNTLQ